MAKLKIRPTSPSFWSLDMPNVRDVLNFYQVYFEEDVTTFSGELLFLCPFHDDHNLGSARFNETNGVYYCFSCGEGGNIIQFVAKLQDISVSEDQKVLAKTFLLSDSSDPEVVRSKLQRFSQQLESSLPKVLEYKNLASKVTERILKQIAERKSLELLKKWLPICTWITYLSPKDVVHEKYNKVLEIYSQFYQELQQGV
jgi:DNA primase